MSASFDLFNMLTVFLAQEGAATEGMGAGIAALGAGLACIGVGLGIGKIARLRRREYRSPTRGFGRHSRCDDPHRGVYRRCLPLRSGRRSDGGHKPNRCIDSGLLLVASRAPAHRASLEDASFLPVLSDSP